MPSFELRSLPLAAVLMTLACGNSAATQVRIENPTATPASAASPPKSGPPKSVYGEPPGPIAGRWTSTCAYMADMVVEIKVDGKAAVGRIAVLGQGVKRGYKEGEDILHLAADDWGQWVGQLRWRGVIGKDRQDPIRFVATSNKLDAVMTTDECFKAMPRVQ